MQRASSLERVLFTVEKIETIEEAKRYEEEKMPMVHRGHHLAAIMVWWRVSCKSVASL